MGIPGVFGTTKLPAVQCTTHEQDDGTILSVCATGNVLIILLSNVTMTPIGNGGGWKWFD